MALQQMALAIAQVHAVAPAEFEELAVGTESRAHPLPVAEPIEAVLPHLHEIVVVDIALMEVAPDAGTGRYGTIGQH